MAASCAEFHVTPDPAKLAVYGLSLVDVQQALERNNAYVGAGYIERYGEQYLIRVPGQITDLDGLRQSWSNRRTASCCACATWRRWPRARNCAPVRQPRTGMKPCSAPSSC
ncbi:hypothetical protein RLIN73S_01440 [Rhodanobacter lindaniclasticus]